MAKAQQTGGGAVIGMIAFAGLWLASTVGLILMYTGLEGLRASEKNARDDSARLISQGERRSIDLFKSASAGGPTMAGLLEGARADTAMLATGDPADDVGAVATKLDEQLRTFRSDRIVPRPAQFQEISYDKALDTLYQIYKSEHELRTGAESRVSELGAEVDNLAQAVQKQKDDFVARAKALSDQFADVEAGHGKYRDVRDKEVSDLTRSFEGRRKENEEDLTMERKRTALLSDQVNQFEARLAAIQAELGDLLIGPKKLATARKPDGQIMTYFPGDDFVFIDLGRGDKLVLGLQFAVYDSGKGIPPDGRAKAQIEIVSIDPRSAECRIVSQATGTVIQVGDLIANPIYDRNRAVTFMVLGEFDLDHNGVSDPNGTAAIEALVTRWGGELSTEITALLDFVVLGRSPRKPRSIAADASADAVARHQTRQAAHASYMDLVQTAKALRVPVLGQEVFLNFLGYSSLQAGR